MHWYLGIYIIGNTARIVYADVFFFGSHRARPNIFITVMNN